MAESLVGIGIVFLKFFTPLLIIFSPFLGGWMNFILDTIDGDILLPLGLEETKYQLIDKIADWVTYVAMIIAARRWQWPIRRSLYWLFSLRTIGQIGFFIFNDERIFFLFPNFLEPLFIIYASIGLAKKEPESFYLKHKKLIWILVCVYKMQDEWITHIANIDRSDAIKTLLNLSANN